MSVKRRAKKPRADGTRVDEISGSVIAVSMRYKGQANDMMTDDYNRYVSKLLMRIARELRKAEYEFDGVEGPTFCDDKNARGGRVSIEATLFYP
jgi:hypothetical protein